MARQVAVTIIPLLISGAFLQGQQLGGLSSQMDHPSNGVLEMTLSPVFPQVLGPHIRGVEPYMVDDVWDGVLAVTLKNVSGSKIQYIRKTWWLQYVVEVFDSVGKPVPLTPFGEQQLSVPAGPHKGYSGGASIVEIDPTQQFTERLILAAVFQLERGATYTIKIRRSRDLPQVDTFGRPIGELSATLVVKGGPGGRGY